MKNFTVQLVAAAALSMTARAQLPRECFYVTQMHGYESDWSDLLSDLPTLMTMYKPGMRLKSITAMQDPEEGNLLTGLQTDLIDADHKNTLQLPMVGAQLDKWESQKVHFKMLQPDKISILTDSELGGICNVNIYQGSKVTSLSKDNEECMPDEEGITETWLRLPEETPLVGFHGNTDGETLTGLGLILLNAEDPVCQKPLSDGEFTMYKGDIYEQSQAAEDSITEDQRSKTAALEALLALDSVQKARQSKAELKEQIEELEDWYDWEDEDDEGDENDMDDEYDEEEDEDELDIPQSYEDLQELLDDMADLDVKRNPRTKQGLKKFFDRLIRHYEDVDDEVDDDIEYSIPIKISELKYVYSTLAIKDKVDGTYFDNRKPEEEATVEDLTELFDELTVHFNLGSDGDLDLENQQTKALADMFERLEDFYAFDAPEEIPDAEALWPIYDQLAEIFGNASDFKVSKNKAQEMYEKIKNGQNINRTFEGQKVDTYEDLQRIAKEQRATEIASLMAQMQKFESIEDENLEYLEQQLDVQESDLFSILNTLENDSHRLDQLQKTLVDLERRQQKRDEEKELNPGPKYDKDGPPPHYLKDSNDAKIDKMMNWTEEIPQLAQIVEDSNKRVTEAEQKFEADAESMIYTFLGVLVAAVAIGMTVGGCLILCCMKCYSRGQQKRLATANRSNLRFTEGNETEFNARTMPCAQTIPDEEKPDLRRGQSEEAFNTNAKLQQKKVRIDDVVQYDGDQPEEAKQHMQMQRNPPSIKIATPDGEEEAEEEGGDFVNVLTSRGLTYDQPKERRSTQITKKVVDGQEKQTPEF